MTLRQVAREINRRLCGLFIPNAEGHAPGRVTGPSFPGIRTGATSCYSTNTFMRIRDADAGEHQTGWTALIARCMQDLLSAKSTQICHPVRNPDHRQHDIEQIGAAIVRLSPRMHGRCNAESAEDKYRNQKPIIERRKKQSRHAASGEAREKHDNEREGNEHSKEDPDHRGD